MRYFQIFKKTFNQILYESNAHAHLLKKETISNNNEHYLLCPFLAIGLSTKQCKVCILNSLIR